MSAFTGTKGKPRIITIVAHDGNYFDVFEGERYCDRLCWDEMLGHIAQITHPAIAKERYEMLTPEQHDNRRNAYRKPRIVEIPRLPAPQQQVDRSGAVR